MTWVVERAVAHGLVTEVLFARAGEGAPVAPGTAVALKRILPHLAGDAEIVAAFRREAELARALDHPNIARVLALDALEGRPCLVMEWLDGLDLRDVLRAALRERARLHAAQALSVGAFVARALEHAHALRDAPGAPLGLVHRDVSPENVFLTRAGEVKLIDFGVAKVRAIATQSGLVVGKASYMAPEQVDGLHVDARTDVFGLGVVLWEALTGRPLWEGASEAEIAQAIRERSAPPPGRFASGLAPEVDALVLSMLAKFPSARPRSAGEVATALEAMARAHGSRSARKELASVVARYAPA